ncbi:MAG: hypothetical protein FWE91_05155 [Defluviitaleaceae bacterium]|nr:hypothetical protein [Defluviitaleaceae bacterium]
MVYKYHIQYQAIEMANSIIPVPENYPLKPGLEEGFAEELKLLVGLAKKIYQNIAETPDAYGLLLTDVYEQNSHKIKHGPIYESAKSLRKPFDLLYALASSGELEGGVFKVSIQAFKTNAKKIRKYGLILNALTGLGFVFNGYTGNGFVKGLEHFYVEFPPEPGVIKVLKTYCDCRNIPDVEIPHIREEEDEFANRFYAVDYKYTAALSALNEIAWVRDKVHTWDDEAKKFYTAFYENAVKESKIKYKGSFYKGSKLAARLRYEDDFWKQDVGYYTVKEYKDVITRGMKTYFVLILYLPTKGGAERFAKLPAHIVKYMKDKPCKDCGTYTPEPNKCPHTVVWEHGGEEYRSCSYFCFHYEHPLVEDIQAYCDLL